MKAVEFFKRCKKNGQEVDLDDDLRTTRDDVRQAWSRRQLAGLAMGIDPVKGAEDVAELACAVEWMRDGIEDGKRKLCDVLGGSGDHFQRALWFCIAGRDPFGAWVDLTWLLLAMENRLSLYRYAREAGLEIMPMMNPYARNGDFGPCGRYDKNFNAEPLKLFDVGR